MKMQSSGKLIAIQLLVIMLISLVIGCGRTPEVLTGTFKCKDDELNVTYGISKITFYSDDTVTILLSGKEYTSTCETIYRNKKTEYGEFGVDIPNTEYSIKFTRYSKEEFDMNNRPLDCYILVRVFRNGEFSLTGHDVFFYKQ